MTSEAYYKSGEAEAYLTYYYTYDTAGNLLTVSQKEGDTTTLLQTYTYGDAQWHDLLTAVNGQAITYDASGNPLSYGGWSFGWQNGRQLKTASKTSDGKTETLEYSYDADGIRTSKTYTVETFTQLPDYTVTFQADGATVKTMTVEDGYTLKDSDYPAVPSQNRLYRRVGEVYVGGAQQCHGAGEVYGSRDADTRCIFKADGFTRQGHDPSRATDIFYKTADYPEVPAKVGCNGAVGEAYCCDSQQCYGAVRVYSADRLQITRSHSRPTGRRVKTMVGRGRLCAAGRATIRRFRKTGRLHRISWP